MLQMRAYVTSFKLQSQATITNQSHPSSSSASGCCCWPSLFSHTHEPSVPQISSLPPPNRSHRWSRLLAAELQPQPTPFTAADEQIQPPVAACRCSPSPPVASPLLLTVLAAGLLVQEGVVMQEDKQMVVGTETGEQKLGKIFIKEELCKEHQVQKEQNQCRNAIHKENKIDQPSLFALPVAMVGRPGVFPYPGHNHNTLIRYPKALPILWTCCTGPRTSNTHKQTIISPTIPPQVIDTPSAAIPGSAILLQSFHHCDCCPSKLQLLLLTASGKCPPSSALLPQVSNQSSCNPHWPPAAGNNPCI
nr:protein TIME FOR COFFEE-like isoform X2 [Ipomoea batatas]